MASGTLFLFFILFGVDAALGLTYGALKANGMAFRGARFAAKDVKRVSAEGAEKGRELAESWQAKRQQRLRARP